MLSLHKYLWKVALFQHRRCLLRLQRLNLNCLFLRPPPLVKYRQEVHWQRVQNLIPPLEVHTFNQILLLWCKGLKRCQVLLQCKDLHRDQIPIEDRLLPDVCDFPTELILCGEGFWLYWFLLSYLSIAISGGGITSIWLTGKLIVDCAALPFCRKTSLARFLDSRNKRYKVLPSFQ